MRIAIAQITTDPGKIEQNLEKILEQIEHARAQKAELVVFPELALTGYGCMDLFYRTELIERTKLAISEIAKASKDIAIVIGHIAPAKDAVRSGNRPSLFNAASLIHDGKVVGTQAKQLLPNYEIFSEERYFIPGDKSQVFPLFGRKIGIQICEDLWDEEYDHKVSRSLISQGADLIVNLSASPFEPGKFEAREERITNLYKEENFKGVFVYANLIGSFDGFEGEVVFDGRSTVHGKTGKLVASAKAFQEMLLTFDCGEAEKEKRELTVSETMPEIEEIYEALLLGIRDFCRRLSVQRAFIGLSGGIDSAVVAGLAVAALGKERVVGVTMPSHVTQSETKIDALLVADHLGIECEERPIVGEFTAWKVQFIESQKRAPSSITVQNKQARIRGAIMMEYANENPGAVVFTTGNKTELATGYCTLYGDMCGALAVLGDVSKLRVYALADLINKKAKREIIPASTIQRVPTAELAPGQADRDNLPADYPVLSPLVDKIVEAGGGVQELAGEFGKDVVETTVKLVNRNEFKRRQAPPAIRVTGHAFGVGRRVPMG